MSKIHVAKGSCLRFQGECWSTRSLRSTHLATGSDWGDCSHCSHCSNVSAQVWSVLNASDKIQTPLQVPSVALWQGMVGSRTTLCLSIFVSSSEPRSHLTRHAGIDLVFWAVTF